MRSIFFFLLIAFGCATTTKAQYNFEITYAGHWQRIDKLLTSEALPASALVEIQKVYNMALNDKVYGQAVKAIIYRMNAQAKMGETDVNTLLDSLKLDAQRLPQPAKSVVYSLIAHVYQTYYQNNRWTISRRTRTEVVDNDITTWDITRLFEEALKYYRLSVQDSEALQKTQLADYSSILVQFNDKLILPTLYDFLTYRTIQAYTGEISAALPQQRFVINQPEYFADVQTFVNYPISTVDTLSPEYQVINYYQQLLRFRLSQPNDAKNQYALININIERLKYIRSKGIYNNNDELYEKALQQVMSNHNGSPEWEYAAYALALFYNEQGDTRQTLNNNVQRNNYQKAIELCEKIIEHDADLESYAKDLIKEIKSAEAQFILGQTQYPNTPILSLVKYRNISKLYLYVYSVSSDFFLSNRSIVTDDFLTKKPLQTQTIALPSQPDYQHYSAEVKIDALPQGTYVLLASEKPINEVNSNNSDILITSALFQVSPLHVILRSIGTEKPTQDDENNSKFTTQIYVTDRKTGKPSPKAQIDIYSTLYNTNQEYVKQNISTYTNNEGLAYIIKPERIYDSVKITQGKHKLIINEWSDWWWDNSKERTDSKTVFFTDRSIYRPGQTVYFKALHFESNNLGTNTLLAKKQINVIFNDVNYKAIAYQMLTTNEYGTVQGSFTIPQGLLNGTMSIQSKNGSIDIQVEEYKRPSFEVTFDSLKNNYKLNDSITVSGLAKALAGYAVDNSKVQYTVVRNVQYRYYGWWFPPLRLPQRQIASGEATTNSKGEFAITFKAEADDVKNNNLVYAYTVTANVTDVNGETRSATSTVYVSNSPLKVNLSTLSFIKNDKPLSVGITTTNLNGNFTPAQVTLTITALKSPQGIIRNRLWQAPDTLALSYNEFKKHFPQDLYGYENIPAKLPILKQVTQLTINTKDTTTINLSALQNQPSGWYRFDIKAINDDGVEIEEQQYAQLSSANPEPIRNMNEWLQVVKNSGEPGENAEIWVAGGEKESYLQYEIVLKSKILERKSIFVGTTPQRIIIPIKEEYRGGFAVQFTMVQNNRLYNNTVNVTVPYTNKQLDIKFTTFRNQLLPGEKEKWTLTVKNKQSEKEIAEMAATLYDASLDAFRPHNWSDFTTFYPQHNNHVSMWKLPNYILSIYSYYDLYYPNKASAFYLKIPYLNTYYSWYKQALYAKDNMMLKNIAARVADPLSSGTQNLSDYVVDDNSEAIPSPLVMPDANSPSPEMYAEQSTGGGGEQQTSLTEITTRQNFNETAFFYPQLRTNDEGEIIIEFTIPESLTRWRMLGFAHTKDFKIGTTSNELITQKQVAISANAPRFFRESDVIEFTAKVNNITNTTLSGQALLRVYDATTLQPIDATVIATPATQAFTVKAGESAGVKWTLKIPAGIQAITYKVTAQAGNHTDGEEKVVPVLTNSMLVTETMSFSIRAGKQAEFTFDKLKENKSTTLRNHRLTLEFTSNPAWYAVQAMPYLMEYPYECAEQLFSRFYANTLSSAIVNSTPRVKQIFDLWRTLPENKEALLSNLEKNQELKQVMLEETPWVMQAQNETERKKRISVLFDLNKMSGEQQRAFDKLQKAQLPDGGFAWFNGLQASRFITQHIVAGFGQLIQLDALNTDFKESAQTMIQNGLSFLDINVKTEYTNLLKEKVDTAKYKIGPIQLHYLYACSFSQHKPTDKKALEAFDFYYRKAKTQWVTHSIYGQALTALVLHRYSDTKTAMAILKSLKERAVTSAEMGMYWRNNVAGYFWYQAPIETQALLIQAFSEIANDMQAVEEMKIWLLRNKQTNDWRTTKATAEAVYALLMTGSKLLDESTPLDIKVGGKSLNETAQTDIRPEQGTGYVKTSWSSADITPAMGTLSVTNPNKNGIAWGGMYWQYFEQLDKITSAETKLKMSKSLFIKKVNEQGNVLTAITDKNSIRVGDLVTVRLELRADRDYEFVHLKDMRASALEPTQTISTYRYQDGLWYYESIKDASTNFFIPYLPKGTYVFEYNLRVTHSGTFSNGVTTFQCMYAPEFSAHSEGINITVE